MTYFIYFKVLLSSIIENAVFTFAQISMWMRKLLSWLDQQRALTIANQNVETLMRMEL